MSAKLVHGPTRTIFPLSPISLVLKIKKRFAVSLIWHHISAILSSILPSWPRPLISYCIPVTPSSGMMTARRLFKTSSKHSLLVAYFAISMTLSQPSYTYRCYRTWNWRRLATAQCSLAWTSGCICEPLTDIHRKELSHHRARVSGCCVVCTEMPVIPLRSTFHSRYRSPCSVLTVFFKSEAL